MDIVTVTLCNNPEQPGMASAWCLPANLLDVEIVVANLLIPHAKPQSVRRTGCYFVSLKDRLKNLGQMIIVFCWRVAFKQE